MGNEADFFRAYPNIDYETYMYKLSCARISLMSMDFTREKHLSEEQAKKYQRFNMRIISDVRDLVGKIPLSK